MVLILVALLGWQSDAPPGDGFRYCGRNSLYILLSLRQRQPSLPQLDRMLNPEDDFSSLADLKAAAAEFGEELEAVKCREDCLESFGQPFIAHLNPIKEGLPGHYVVVCSVTSKKLTYIEGTFLVERTVDRADFGRRWSGYLLVSESRSLVKRGGWPFYGAIVLIVACLGFSIAFMRWRGGTDDSLI